MNLFRLTAVAAVLAFSVPFAQRAPARAAAASCAVHAFRPAGSYKASTLLGRPGLILSGGGLTTMPHAPVFRFIRERVQAAPGTRAGNLVILGASDDERYYSDPFYAQSRFASVREIYIPPCASRAAVDGAAHYVNGADAVLFAGGDQAHYVAWKGSKLIDAVKRVYARGGVVGGGSAGLAIQGAVVYDSVAGDRVLPDDQNVGSRDASANPYEPAISFTTNFLAWPTLRDSITDTHFARRDRFGRLTAFMARAIRDRLVAPYRIYGVAVDEGAALLVDANGMATLAIQRESDGYAPRGAYILTGGPARRIVPGKPLLYTVAVTHLTQSGQQYDLVSHRGTGARYSVTVNGAARPIYSRNPY